MKSNIGMKTKQLALCGVLCALGTVIMIFGGVIPIAIYVCPAFASLLLIPIRRECGRGLTAVAYSVIALLSVLLVPDKETAFVFVFFGYYPIVKEYFDRLRFLPLRFLVKLIFFNASAVILYGLLIFVFQLQALVAEYAEATATLLIITMVMANITFVLLDVCIGFTGELYEKKIRGKFFK